MSRAGPGRVSTDQSNESAASTPVAELALIPSYTLAGLPAAGTAGRLARVTDDAAWFLYGDDGTAWRRLAAALTTTNSVLDYPLLSGQTFAPIIRVGGGTGSTGAAYGIKGNYSAADNSELLTFGYNVAAGTSQGRESASLPTFRIAMESNAPGTPRAMEHHWAYTSADGLQNLRFMTMGINLGGADIHKATINFNTLGAAPQNLKIGPTDENGVVAPTVTIIPQLHVFSGSSINANLVIAAAPSEIMSGPSAGDAKMRRLTLGINTNLADSRTPDATLDIMSGLVHLPAGGTAAGPILAFADNNTTHAGFNTGIFNPSTGVLAFSAGGTEFMRFGTAGAPILMRRTTGAGVGGDIQIRGGLLLDEGADVVALRLEAVGTVGRLRIESNHPLAFWTNNAENARITAAGVFITELTSVGSYTPTSASDGDIVTPNARGLRGRNAAGNDTIPVIRVGVNDRITFGHARTGAAVPGNFAANFYIEFEDTAGAKFFVPAMNAGW